MQVAHGKFNIEKYCFNILQTGIVFLKLLNSSLPDTMERKNIYDRFFFEHLLYSFSNNSYKRVVN
jgi:hypothetical protein